MVYPEVLKPMAHTFGMCHWLNQDPKYRLACENQINASTFPPVKGRF
jgi:hypothetical protein